MNPQQNQNNQPDYGFIVNQPGVPPPKKGLPKPLIVLGGVLVLGAVLLLAVVIFVPKNNVSQVAQVPAGQSEATRVTQNYISAIGQNSIDEAYGMLSSSAKEQANPAFFAELAPDIFSNIDTASCAQNGTPQEEKDSTTVVMICKTKVGEANAELVFNVVAENQATKINSYEILATTKEPQNA